MAKIGNEATLILELAHDRMERKLEFKEENISKDPVFSYDVDFTKGYRQGFLDYNNTLFEITIELERK